MTDQKKRPTMSIVPPDDEDDDRLRRALGQAAPPAAHPPVAEPVSTPKEAKAPSAPVAPAALPEKPNKRKVTVSVRMSPETQANLASLGDSIGWSSNRIMTALIEGQSEALMAVYRKDGVAGALRLLGKG
jgi:hypothetical protein